MSGGVGSVSTLLLDLPDGHNEHTIAYLLTHWVVDGKDGSQIQSSVVWISMDTQGSGIYLHSLRTDAARLLTFTQEIVLILPAWLEDDHLEVKLDTSDADRASHTTPQSNSLSKQPVKQPGTQEPT